jgi:VIT1/CCC1 family predicted Fe2+/Mn2+ transporter
VVVTTFPVVIPFLVSDNASRALRASNAIAVAMLFMTGYLFARMTGRRPWVVGALMVLLGCALVGLTMALGG